MRFGAGNQFWKARSTHGREKTFKTPQDLWDSSCEYFEWVESNPLYEYKAFAYQGESWIEKIPKMRAMTIGGLCLFLGVSQDFLTNFEKRLNKEKEEDLDFLRIITQIKDTIRNQKFTGAAADLLNSTIISRDLGLSDKKEFDHKSSDSSMSPKDLDPDLLKSLVDKLTD